MQAALIDGNALAAKARSEVAERVKFLTSHGHAVKLAALLVGASPSGELYAQRQGESCSALGIGYDLHTLPQDATMQQVKAEIRRMNKDKSVTGIMMHLPLPGHLDTQRLQFEIDVVKDVEGVNPANIGYVVYGHTLIAPSTAQAVIEMIRSTGTELRGADAVVVGASQIVGRPLALLLTEHLATVTLCHIETKDLVEHTCRAGIIVVAVGKPGLLTGDMIKPGAVVIDVGINRVTQPDGTKKTVGDVDFESVSKKASHLTPVPGGVGPMTVAMLLKNTVRSADILHGYLKR